MKSRPAMIAFCLGGFATFCHADIHYTVKYSGDKKLQVSVEIPVTSAVTSLQSPNWGPGSYRLADNWQRLQDVHAFSDDGKEITTTKPNDYTWTIPTAGVKTLRFSYTESTGGRERFGDGTTDESVIHYSGPATYVYVVERKMEPCFLRLDLPEGWKVATGLTMKGGKYWAPTYDAFADNPVTMGMYRELSYNAVGKKHILALYGVAKDDVDTDKLLKACSFISQMENDFFGNRPPYDHYVWHFNMTKRPDGGSGLEHLASTEITLANGLGDGAIGVCAHEFFHLWNVKRIRSKVLGPFDYTKLPETGALWWLEGVTDYYAHQMMSRYGYWDDQHFYKTLLGQVATIRANENRLTVSPYDASFKVGLAANGRGNSNGFNISYYNLGFLLGFMLDTEIISRTQGRRSLDDVELALWDLCKNDQPGFAEDEIRKQLIRFGGPDMGTIYDNWVMKPGELPVEAQLAKIGMAMNKVDRKIPSLGIIATPSLTRGFVVSKVSGAAEGKIMVDDLITEINGKAVTSTRTYNDALRDLKEGDAVKVKITRGDKSSDIDLVMGSTSRASFEIAPLAGASPEAARLREIFMYRGKKGWQPK